MTSENGQRTAILALLVKGHVLRRLVVLVLVCVAVTTVIGPAPARVAISSADAKLSLFSQPVRAASPGSQLWVALYKGPGTGAEAVGSAAVSPDGATVYVAGAPVGAPGLVLVAYDAATGEQLWAANTPLSANGNRVAVSPDGSKVFVTGSNYGQGSSNDYATVAYDAASGSQLWLATYNGPGNSSDLADALAVSPDGSKVFVTGVIVDASRNENYGTIAYDADGGTQLWVASYSYGQANAVAVSPDGSKVFVTGESPGPDSLEDYATVAYNAASGDQRWVARYSAPGNSGDSAHGVAVSPDGSTVFVTGSSSGVGTFGADYTTIAYHASSGSQLWLTRYNDGANGDDEVTALALSPDGSKVFVTGTSENANGGFNYATVAYNAFFGKHLWTARYTREGNDVPVGVAVSPDGSTVYVSGTAGPAPNTRGRDVFATLAYNSTNGSQLWVARYQGTRKTFQPEADALALNPNGSALYVTGIGGGGITTVAYATR